MRTLNLFIIGLMVTTLLTAAPVQANQPAIQQDQLIARAVNQLKATGNGLRLHNPRHQVDYTADGVTFSARNGAPEWRWQLQHLGTASQNLLTQPVLRPDGAGDDVYYHHGDVIEQYIAHRDTIEQRFVLNKPLLLDGQDLVITGTINSSGEFAQTSNGWQWKNTSGSVQLGQVTVFDASGNKLAADMTVSAEHSRITVPFNALAQAHYPVTIDPEIGANDFRISDVGGNGNTSVSALSASLAYNRTDNEYLVVWSGDDIDSPGIAAGELEIFGQLLDASDGSEIGTDFRISDAGGSGLEDFEADAPGVAYNSTDNQYLVVWSADDTDVPGIVDNEFEIFGQRLAADGSAVGTNDFRISDAGGTGSSAAVALTPAVIYNSTNNEYLVAWQADDTDAAGTVNNEFEIYGQRLAANGAAVGTNDFRISDAGGSGSFTPTANGAELAYNATNNEYLVVWQADDTDVNDINDNEFEVYGQRLDASNGNEIGTNDFRISDAGGSGNSAVFAGQPAVAYNSANNEYLVVWHSDDSDAGLLDNEFEIFGQRLDASDGSALGSNDFRISDAGGNGNGSGDIDAFSPEIAYNSLNNEYMVSWQADDTDTPGIIDGDLEMFAQRIDASDGSDIGSEFRVSDANGTGTTDSSTTNPMIAYNSVNNEFLITWDSADTDTVGIFPGEGEIFGQRLNAATGVEVGANDFRISSVGGTGNGDVDAAEPAVAYNSVDNQYLVVWEADDIDVPGILPGENEIFGQLLDGVDGSEIGVDFRISDAGGTGNQDVAAGDPSVAYNSIDNEYLVVWRADDIDVPGIIDEEFEVFGQRLSPDGSEVGTNDFRISDINGNGVLSEGDVEPEVAYNSTDNEYLVVWATEDTDTAGIVAGEVEVFGQRLAADGAELGANDFRISDAGGDGNPDIEASEPDVAYNVVDNLYLVVWDGNDTDTPGIIENESEIFGQLINAVDGSEVGVNDFRISDVGGDGTNTDAREPTVAHNNLDNEFLVVWEADDTDTPGVQESEDEVFGQRLNGTDGSEVGPNDFIISNAGGIGVDTSFDVDDAEVAYNPLNNEYLVVWEADDSDIPGIVDNEEEIYGQRVAADGTPIGFNDFRISDSGGTGSSDTGAEIPAVMYNPAADEYLVVWEGDDTDQPGVFEGESEIYGQRIGTEDLFGDGFEGN